MTSFTGAGQPVVAFDCDGTLNSVGEAPIGVDTGQKWNLDLLRACLDAGWRVGVMTCNVPGFVAKQLESFGVTAYPDERMEYKVPPLLHPLNSVRRYVLVTNRKLLADWYLDDHNIEYAYGDPIGPVAERMGLPVSVMGYAMPLHRDGGTGQLTDRMGRFVPSGLMLDSSGT